MSFFTRTLGRLRKEDHGFSLMETVVALGVLFIALLALARTAAVGFTDIALSRQRTQANQIANQVLEQVRGLTYERVGQGLKTSNLTGDPNILACPDGRYYRICPASDPAAEKIVHTADPSPDVPLVPHRTTFGTSQGYTSTYTASVYVTHAKAVPQTGAYRVTVAVTWAPAARPGVSSSVTTQSLLYTPEGTTDATTGGGTAPFFYGTGSIGRAPVTMTPNPGVAGGTGLQGLLPWDSMTVNLYGLENSIQQQALTRAESKVVLTGASKVVDGVETLVGGDAAESLADNDPSTAPTTSSSPSSLMQSAVATSMSGGGNAIEVEAASGSLASSCTPPPGLKWFTGFETGGIMGGGAGSGPTSGGMFSLFSDGGGSSSVTVDSTVKRSGAYSMKVVPAGQSTGVNYAFPASQTTAVYRFGIRFASLPTANVGQLVHVKMGTSDTNTAPWANLRYNATSQRLEFGFAFADLTPVGLVSGPVVQAGTWYMVDVKLNVGANPWTLDWMVDGVPQPSTSVATSANVLYRLKFGGYNSTYTINIDDVQLSSALADYPLPDSTFKVLRPNGTPWWQFCNGCFQTEIGGAISSTSHTRLDEVPMSPSTDGIRQVSNDTTGYVEFDFEDPTETCIGGVMGSFTYQADGSQAMSLKGTIFDGSTESCILGSFFSGTCNRRVNVSGTFQRGSAGMVTPAASPWTTAAVSGLRAKIGYSDDAAPDPVWHGILLEYAVVPSTGTGAEGDAGTETGSTASTTAAGATTPCGFPTQLDGLACAYAQEDYSTAGPPHLSLKAGVQSSDTLMARLYRYTPSTTPGSINYVWGRRAVGGGGVGTLKETAVRYPGTHTFAPIMPFVGSAPPGWQGHWLKYDAGTTASSVSAEAGIGASAPSFTSAGTISYWNGSGYTSMTPPAAGGPIPLAPVDYFPSGGTYRTKISGSLATSPSFTSQVPAGATGIADRTEARASVGSPVSGTFTYQVIYVPTNEVVGDFTISVDLGTLSATARYAP